MSQQVNVAEPGLALRIGIAGALGIGTLVSGMVVSRRGRRLVKEAWQGRRRTRIEDGVLDALWGDRTIGRREIEVIEIAPGVVRLSGSVASDTERRRALDLAQKIRNVSSVSDHLAVREI